MKKNRIAILAFLMVLAISALACEFSASTANIASAKLSADETGSPTTTVFTADQTFYCVVTLANAPDDTTLKAVWTAVDVEGEEPNTAIGEKELTGGGNPYVFNASVDGSWPIGTYKVDLYLNDKLDRTLEFEVQ